jgi:hypothetical protein
VKQPPSQFPTSLMLAARELDRIRRTDVPRPPLSLLRTAAVGAGGEAGLLRRECEGRVSPGPVARSVANNKVDGLHAGTGLNPEGVHAGCLPEVEEGV